MDVMRCDECGVEAPRWMGYRKDLEWFTLHTSGMNLHFHLCTWKCLQRFTSKHPTTPPDIGQMELQKLDQFHQQRMPPRTDHERRSHRKHGSKK